jgi:hypothetical protein
VRENTPLRAPHTCLGRCWGKTGPDIKLTSETTEDLNVSIVDGDATGIKQDDLKDWKETAAQMASIYENAFITLTATYAIDSNEGLFSADQDCTPKQLAERRDMYVRERKKGTGHAYCWYVEEYNSARFVLV